MWPSPYCPPLKKSNLLVPLASGDAKLQTVSAGSSTPSDERGDLEAQRAPREDPSTKRVHSSTQSQTSTARISDRTRRTILTSRNTVWVYRHTKNTAELGATELGTNGVANSRECLGPRRPFLYSFRLLHHYPRSTLVPISISSKSYTAALIFSAALAVLIASADLTIAAEPAASSQSPLAQLPSQAGAHLEKIKALGDNEWLNLGAPAADPKWGRAGGRSWGAKALILAPELQGAFLTGEGRHNYVKPDGYAMDDLWFYDINAHRWICLYPGMDPRTFTQRVENKELKIDDEGLLRDNDGQAIPVHTLTHAWGFLTYDPDRKKLAFLGNNGLDRYYMPGVEQMEKGLSLLDKRIKEKQQALYTPWFYDVRSDKFERAVATGSIGYNGRGFPQLHYLPAKKEYIVVGSYGAAFFGPASNKWREVVPEGPGPKSSDACGCYDSQRNRVYRNGGDGTEAHELMAYDIDSNRWLALEPKGRGPEAADTNGAFYEYDARLDKVIAMHFTGKSPGIYVYLPQTNSWDAPLPFPADMPKFNFAANTCFVPALNVYFLHVAGDSSDDGVVWAYRYRHNKTDRK